MKEERCKQKVWAGWSHHRCSRKATHGEYCWQHNPAKVEERRKAADKRHREKMDNSAIGMISRKLAEQKAIVEELKAENAALKAQINKDTT